MSSIELKPCPFCGGKASVINTTALGLDCKSVMCRKCKAKVNFFNGTNSEERAINAWNRRCDNDGVL